MSGEQVIERMWKAPLELVWELWTTPEGLGSWWGPRGFRVEVQSMDLKVGGTFAYTMNAASPEMVEMMKAKGRPASFGVSATYTVVEPPHRLAYDSPFGPEMLSTSVEFTQLPEGVKMVLTISATKPEMTPGAAMGWRSALERFGERLEAQGA